MDVHNVKYKKIRKNNTTLVFFNKKLIQKFNPKYVELVHSTPIIKKDYFVNRWVIEDKHGNEYKIRQSHKTLIYSLDNTTAEFNIDFISSLLFKGDLKLFCNNNSLPEDSIIDTVFFNSHLKDLPISKKMVNMPKTLWDISDIFKNIYSSIIIIDKIIVGRVLCEILNEKEIEEEDVISKRMNLYISNVDIRNEYQGLGLCKPLVSFMIENLRNLGYEQLFIYNASRTKGGTPACFCYYRAGKENRYKMRTKKAGKVMIMKEDDCYHAKRNETYYYMSDDIYKRGVNKIKTKFKIK